MSAWHIIPENAYYAHFRNTFWHHMQNTFEKSYGNENEENLIPANTHSMTFYILNVYWKIVLLECVTNINIKHRLRSARTSTQSDQNLRRVHDLYKSDPPAKRHSWYLLVSNSLYFRRRTNSPPPPPPPPSLNAGLVVPHWEQSARVKMLVWP